MRRRHILRRRVDGVVLLDKRAGVSSNKALQEVRDLFRAEKAGHTGSLDPLATGLLPVCLGEATKVSAFLLDADKHYRVTCRLGVKTTTGDAEGEVTETAPVPALDAVHVTTILERFKGDIEQIPPMYSALKHAGKRLYELARRGVDVERRPRTVTIHELRLLAIDGECLEFEAQCSKGTYIRTLAEDIAAALGTVGHVAALRRLGVGPYGAEGMHTVEALQALAAQGQAALDAVLLPVDSAIRDWPAVTLTTDMAWYLLRGQAVLVPRAPTAGHVRIYAETGRFLGVGEIRDDGLVAPRRLVAPPSHA